jgi:hypothetical protein
LMCFPGKLLTYFLNDSEMVPLTPVITGIIFVLFFPRAVFLLYGLYILQSTYLLEFQCLLLLLLLLLFDSRQYTQSMKRTIPNVI